ncbi:MerR family transcriptional regulator [Brachybacterium sp. AOP43-C2-M15]|uniref:MerR family transcriptional regulator n=1 Tax=Brachybacterium sp. AOP43-C2-M15 TaxID=3457661 RepID=UPI0040341662
MTALDTRVSPAASVSLSIGELSARTGVSVRSLRYYEEQELLRPLRTAAGHRRFDAEAVDRVLLVQRLFAAGLSSREIAPVLPCLLGRDSGEQGLEALHAHRARLEQEIARMRDTAEILDEVLEERRGR